MEKIGQYEIGDLLGEGGIGQVHAAFDTVLQREVAIKSLRPELLSDINFVERFRAEATSLARLNHPNITTLYSLIPDGKNLYMVMERVRGHTLDEILKQRKAPLDVREALAIIAQGADGLAYAHSMGVIHRDIKPSNLMIAENGVLKIMDFGIARVRGSQRLTRSGSIVGTLAYMAPEQLRGEEGDEACDLYSLAIVLYELLSGAPPFSANSDYELMQAQINARPERLIPRVAGLEPRVEAALLKALSKKPAQRYPSCRAFSDALGASALRLDAPKILHNDTRLIDPGSMPMPFPAAEPPSRPGVLAAMPPGVRAAALGGGGALLVAACIAAFMLIPGSSPPKTPVVVAAKPITGQPSVSGQTPPVVPTNLTPSSQPTLQSLPTQSGGEQAGGSGNSAAASGSLADITAAADQGDAAAQNALGFKYAQGEDGLPHDDTKAVALYRKSASQGFAKADVNLGDMYLYGRGGLDKSYADAFGWYLKAAQQDLPEAQYRLGVMYEKGLGTAMDVQRAVRLYRDAANHGNAEAQNLLGFLYATGGDGVPHDDDVAVGWYQKAAVQGLAKAEANLGDMYFRGSGVERSYTQAMAWYQKASDQQFADAQYRLGVMFERGLGADQSNENAIAFYQKAARNGSLDAQRALDRLNAKISGNQ